MSDETILPWQPSAQLGEKRSHGGKVYVCVSTAWAHHAPDSVNGPLGWRTPEDIDQDRVSAEERALLAREAAEAHKRAQAEAFDIAVKAAVEAELAKRKESTGVETAAQNEADS